MVVCKNLHVIVQLLVLISLDDPRPPFLPKALVSPPSIRNENVCNDPLMQGEFGPMYINVLNSDVVFACEVNISAEGSEPD